MKILLVVATGRCVWDDVAKITPWLGKNTIARKRLTNSGVLKPPIVPLYDVMTVSHMVMFWPKEPPKYAVSIHGKQLVHWVNGRVYSRIEKKPITYAMKSRRGGDDGLDNYGKFYEGDVTTSGMYAACLGLHLGYDKIILAGVPYDNTGHFYDPPLDGVLGRMRTKFEYHFIFKRAWDLLKDKSNNKIRAVSGNLIKCFGKLEKEWLKE